MKETVRPLLIQRSIRKAFYGEEYARARREAAACLRNLQPKGSQPAVDKIMDFIEYLAYCEKRKGIDVEAVWFFFFYYFVRFMYLAKDYIAEKRRGDPTLWEESAALYPKLCSLETRKRKMLGASLDLSQEDIRQFLKDERLRMVGPVHHA